ncbi:MAG: hypothetical protein Q8P18_34095 [Pseudomonadota bacterium]|nr:hypothetical protein [Pseudomonadota bacterium]
MRTSPPPHALPSPSLAAPMRTLPLALLLGCGDISNAFLLEDAEFLDSLPSEARHTVLLEPVLLDPSADSGEADWLERAPRLLAVSHDVSTGVNTPLLELLATIDYVRTVLPSGRTPDGRRWGPYDWLGDVQIELQSNRTGQGRFDWSLDALTPSTRLSYVTGTHYAGPSVAAGDGQFTWIFDELAALVGDPARGTLTVDYDNRVGIDLLVDIAGVTAGIEPPLTAQYAYQLIAGEGDFQYQTSADLNDDGVAEDYAIRTRWNVGVGGRSDATVTGGFLGTTVERWSQCWDGGVNLVYEADDLGWFEASGEESACEYPTFLVVDRI